MDATPPLDYSRIELEGFLPTGWKLAAEGGKGAWDPRREVWRTSVRDGLDMEWPLLVGGPDAARLGRLPALRAAIDELFRARLGRGTRGLGISTGGRAA